MTAGGDCIVLDVSCVYTNNFRVEVGQWFDQRSAPSRSGGAKENTLKKIIIVAMTLLCSTAIAEARGSRGGFRISYGGGHHTSSHGGAYIGASGSSHRGGTTAT